MTDSLWPHGLQQARLPYPPLSPRVSSNSCPLTQWCHPTISSCCPLLLLPSIFPSIRVFSNESALYIRWPKYWSFSFSIGPLTEYSGLISFRIDWLDLLAVQGTPKSLIQHHSSKASVLHIRWPKYWSFSFSMSLSNEYSGLISFRVDWFDFLTVQGTQESSPTPQVKRNQFFDAQPSLSSKFHIHTWLLEKS